MKTKRIGDYVIYGVGGLVLFMVTADAIAQTFFNQPDVYSLAQKWAQEISNWGVSAA